MTITELREQGFNVGDYVLIPNHEYYNEYIDEEKKCYFFYIGRIYKCDEKYYIDGYVVNTDEKLDCRNLHSTYSFNQSFENHKRISRIQPIFQSVEHIYLEENCSIKKIDKTVFDKLMKKLTNVADDIFEVFLKA